MTVAAVLLAAGAGTRFAVSTGGRPGDPPHKLLGVIDGQTVIARAVGEARAGGFDEVIVVTGASEAVERALPVDGVSVVRNPRWQEGIATSLIAAVDHSRAQGHDAVVVGLADQPGVPAEAWRLVRSASGTAIAVATYAGARRNPVRLDASVWDDLARSGDEGARSVMRLRPELVTEIPCPGNPGDIDTVEDLRTWS